MGKLFIIRGIPGSGKSTLAKKMLSEGKVDSHYEADMFFVTDGVYRFDPLKLSEAHDWCFDSVKCALLIRNENVAVSNTFTKRWEAERYLALPVSVEIITCTGDYGNVHGVPPDKLEIMKARFEFDTSDWQ